MIAVLVVFAIGLAVIGYEKRLRQAPPPVTDTMRAVVDARDVGLTAFGTLPEVIPSLAAPEPTKLEIIAPGGKAGDTLHAIDQKVDPFGATTAVDTLAHFGAERSSEDKAISGASSLGSLGLDVGADIQVVSDIVSVLGNNGSIPRADREKIEVAKTLNPQAQAMLDEIDRTTSIDQLFAVLRKWNSGTVGGTSAVAIVTMFRLQPDELAGAGIAWSGHEAASLAADARMTWIAPYAGDAAARVPVFVGDPNPVYPTVQAAAFAALIRTRPETFTIQLQAGVVQSFKDPINAAVRDAITNALTRMQGF